jgi:hypothetical protein
MCLAPNTEKWPSGLRRTLGKRVEGNLTQVRILSSPPFSKLFFSALM